MSAGNNSVIVALDATTGKEIWTHPAEGRPTKRGYNYWESKDRTDRRLIFGSQQLPSGARRANRQADQLVRQ